MEVFECVLYMEVNPIDAGFSVIIALELDIPWLRGRTGPGKFLYLKKLFSINCFPELESPVKS